MAKPGKMAARVADVNAVQKMMQQGQLDTAQQALHPLLRLNPRNPLALRLLGEVLHAMGKSTEALAPCQQAFALQPAADSARALLAVAETLQRFDLAQACLRVLIRSQPDEPYYCYRLALILKSNANQADEAMQLLQQCITRGFMPRESHYQLGKIAQFCLDQRDLARQSYLSALQLDPDYVDARIALAHLYCENGHVEQAITLLQDLLAAGTHNNAELYSLLGVSLLRLGQHRQALDFMRQAAQAEPDNPEVFSNYLFRATYTNQLTADEWLAEHRRFGQLAAARAKPFSDWDNSRDTARCLRIGFVSGDFKQHPVSTFFEPLLREMDRRQCEVFCYYNHSYRDEVTVRLESMANGWRDVPLLSDAALAQQIHEDRIDILIDLSVHTSHNRLPVFAWRPAPLQMTWLGYPATTGLREVDYILLDRHYLPPAESGPFAVETPLLLNGYRVYQPLPDMHKLPIKPLPALEKGYVTFGSFNDFNKVDSLVLDTWAELLNRLPTARLAMIVHARESITHVQQYLGERGIAAERLMLFTKLSFSHFLQLHYHVDIALDTFPFTGLTTAMHGLWMGVPAITLAGERSTSRSGLSLLAALELEDFAASSREHYIERACFWAAHLPQLNEIRLGLRERLQASPLMDYPAFARDFETTLRRAWQQWCQSA